MLGVGAWGRSATAQSSAKDGGASSGNKPAWGPLRTGAPPLGPSRPAPWAKIASGAPASAPSSGSNSGAGGASSTSAARKEEPIDYFEMTS